jgi:hypothetical protein
MAEVLNEFVSTVFTREDMEKVPQAHEMETDETPEIGFSTEKVKKKDKVTKDSRSSWTRWNRAPCFTGAGG